MLALVLVFVASVTDGIDGYLARHFAWTSRLGSYLDPIADKLLLVSLYIVLGIAGVVPIWLMWLVLGTRRADLSHGRLRVSIHEQSGVSRQRMGQDQHDYPDGCGGGAAGRASI